MSLRNRHKSPVPPQGAELLQKSPGKSTVSWQGDSLSDSLSDSRLAKLIEVWPALAADVKAEILRLTGFDFDDFNDVTATLTRKGVSR
jgi:hypothetical protein